MTSAIEVKGLTKLYRKQVALSNIDWLIPSQTIVGLLGGNGVGKTTLLKILAGILPFNQGEVRLLGRPLGDSMVRKKVSFLSEAPYFAGDLSGKFLMGIFSKLDRQNYRESLDSFKIKKEWLNRPIREYSKGMLQRFNLAQAVLGKKEILLLDEPMSGLDPVAQEWMIEQICRWKGEGKTILFSSHLLNDIEALADELAILDEGKLLFSGTKEKLLELSSASSLLAAYKKFQPASLT